MKGNGEEEIEVKFFVKDLEEIGKRLEEIGAELVKERVHEYNLRFDTPDGKLTAESRVLRLRQDDRVRLTYKGRTDKSRGVNARQEIEFSVGDFDAAQHFLEALGYEVSVIYEKYRTTYKLDDSEIVLDEMPYGNFIEIEGVDPEGIRAVAERLGLEWGLRTLPSYLEMFSRVKEELGLKFRDLTFANFEEIEVGEEILRTDNKDN